MLLTCLERQVAASEVLLVCCQCVANVLLTCLERQVAASEVLLMCCQCVANLLLTCLERQVAASEVLSNMLFAIGDYQQSKQVLA